LSYPGDESKATLHLRVTIRAQQEALANLSTQTLNAAGHTVLGDTELLGSRVEMMELESSHAAVVATEPAACPSLLDEDLLDPTPPPHHGLLTAPATTKIAPTVSDVTAVAVAGTYEQRLQQTGFTSRAGSIR
jgi:hypothetical protein